MNTRTQVVGENRLTGMAVVVGYLALYGLLLLVMQRGGFDVSEPLLILGLLGVGFSAAVWLLTLKVTPLPYSVLFPEKELSLVVAWLLPVVLFVTWGLAFLHRHFVVEPETSLVILAAKLAVFVAGPAILMSAFCGYRLQQMTPLAMPVSHVAVMIAMSLLLLVFESVFGHGLRDVLSAHVPAGTLAIGIPFSMILLAIEAGVVEEFFFRVLLQTRLAAALKSEWAGIFLSSLLFGLVHSPGIYLRGALAQEGVQNPSLLMAVGYSVVVVSVAGLFLGFLWARTRNFLLIVVVHAAGDLLPNLLPTMRAFHLWH